MGKLSKLLIGIVLIGFGIVFGLAWKNGQINLKTLKKKYISLTSPINQGQPDSKQHSVSSDWKTYNSKWSDFALKYKSGFNVTERQLKDKKLVRFMLVGPSQEKNTDLYDGIVLSIGQGKYADFKSFQAFVENEKDQVSQIGEVVQSMEKTTFQGYPAYRYRIKTLNEAEKMFVSLGNQKYLSISYSVQDPTGQNFQKILDEMIDSIGISPSAQNKSKTASKKKFEGQNIKFVHPEKINVSQSGNQIQMTHSIEYKHSDPCDFKGKGGDMEKLIDFDVNMQYVDKGTIQAIKQNERQNIKDKIQGYKLTTSTGFIENIQIGNWSGYKIIQGVENCGEYRYYLSKGNQTIMINKKMIAELKDSHMKQKMEEQLDSKQLNKIINIEKSKEILQKIIQSVEIQ